MRNMKRKVSDAEDAYNRVRAFVSVIPPEILASLRVEFTKPTIIDALLKKIKKEIGLVTIEHKESNWQYCFWHGELEFREFLKQVL